MAMTPMSTEPPPAHSEQVTMTLLSDIEPAISDALDSLGKRMTKGMEDMYYFYATKHIHDILDAFIVLRGQHRLDGARLLVRPALETMLKLRAVRAEPHPLHRALLADNKEIDKWFSSTARRHRVPYTRIFQAGGVGQLSDTVSCCSLELIASKMTHRSPHMTRQRRSASNRSCATRYRGFSHYTHGLLEAISGGLDELIDPEASRVILQSAMTALDTLTHLGANCPNFESLSQRATEVLGKEPDKLLRQKSDEA